MTYRQAIQYLGAFVNYEQVSDYPYKESLKLERIRGFLNTIGSPQEKLKCLHIAGTKGKGSTCAFLTYILREAGYKTGLYTSPHLKDFRERIRILNPSLVAPACRTGRRRSSLVFEGMISKGELAALVQRLKPTIDEYNRSSQYGPLTFFEVYTAIAFVYFKQKKVDFAVLETGMGGRLDATNVAEPLACAITPISYEHTQKLGKTLIEIAKEKAGIIKKSRSSFVVRRSFVISAPQEKEVQAVIRNRCREVDAKLYEVGKDIKYRKNKTGFGIRTPFAEYKNLKINLLGEHQLVNAATAVGLIDALRKYNISIGANSIKKGLYNTVWPGRCEVISRNPTIVLDGAQNSASAAALGKAIKDNFRYRKLILVLGISSDKDIAGICREICPLADKIILTQADNPRAAGVEEIEKVIGSMVKGQWSRVAKSKDIREAKKTAFAIAASRDLILVTGSLFVAGEFR